MAELETGTRIAGRYSLENRLDAGGRAQVWAATDDELQRKVAIKILVTPAGGDPAFIEAFRAEAQAEAGLNHPAIVEVFAAHSTRPQPPRPALRPRSESGTA